MNLPVATDTKPSIVELTEGVHAWCSCGLSKSGAFCDGSHKGTTFRPKIMKVDVAETVALCMCKQSKNPPFCDGSHSAL
jgi:CDGSH-type Zn-finger protein